MHQQPQADPDHRVARGAQRGVQLELLEVGTGVLHAGQALPVGELGRLGQALDVLGGGGARQSRFNQLHRRLLEDASGVARAIALDLPARRVGRLISNAEAGEGGRVYPGGVAVVRLDGHRPVGHHPVQELSMRHPTGKDGVKPPPAEQPVPIVVSLGETGDPLQDAVDSGFAR